MELITTAIVAAVGKLAEPAIKDAYAGLKSLIVNKFGGSSEVVEAVEQLEKKPDSLARKAVLEEEFAEVRLDQDEEINQASEKILHLIKSLPGGQQVVNQTVIGNQNIFSGIGDVTIKKG